MTSSVPSGLPIRMISKVTRGFGRGSRDLGIPTANLSRESIVCSLDFNSLPCGIYWGFAKIKSSTKEEGANNDPVYNAAISIGYNPCFNNEEKTVEPHLIASPDDKTRHASTCGETLLRDFYDDTIRLTVLGFLRDEAPFDGIDNLIAAIKSDIKQSEAFCNNLQDKTIAQEKEWVDSDEAC